MNLAMCLSIVWCLASSNGRGVMDSLVLGAHQRAPDVAAQRGQPGPVVDCGPTAASLRGYQSFFFSTETSFVATAGPHAGEMISNGDELSEDGTIVNTNPELAGTFCQQPPFFDVGLDALHHAPDGSVLFSTEFGWFDECLGVQVSDGDLLRNDGTVVRTNFQLMGNFNPKPVVPDVGLDAVDVRPLGEIYFSTEMDIFDEFLGVALKNGDILSDVGYVVMTNEQLMRNFCPQPPVGDMGLDALFVPANGEIWFSTETGWFDECMGVPISEGDLLSDAGYVVRSNPLLLRNFIDPTGAPGRDEGLDAVWREQRTPFAGCGVLESGPQGCIQFVTSNGDRYFIENVGGFGAGDRVFVSGLLNPVSILCLPFTAPGIEDNTISAGFSGCGTLVQGAECLLFQADSGGLWVLDFYNNFAAGERVWVTGCIEFGCGTFCLQGDGCIHNDSIWSCFEDCGVLTAGPHGCVALLQTDNGALYAIENIDGFNIGDRVWVQGCLNQQSNICFPPFSPAIEDNTIGRCFEGCGQLAPGPQGCIVFQTDDGQGYFLENTGSLGSAERVWVKGCLNPSSTLCPPFTAPGIEDNSIGRCFEGCGTIVIGPLNSFLFATDSGELYCLENLSLFGPGDRVWVQGCLNNSCMFCFGGSGCIEDNLIFECQACCLSDGSCRDLAVRTCVEIGGQPGGSGTQCLGDADGDGIDDACQGPICEPAADEQSCNLNTCPSLQHECVPQRIRFNAVTLQYRVLECACQSPNVCHVEISPVDPPSPPACVGVCPQGTQCRLVVTFVSENEDDYECTCDPVEACCFDDGNCLETTPAECLNLGGAPQGPGSFCGALSCLQACCLPDGSCSDLPPGDCIFLGGTPHGVNTQCSSSLQCEACCFDDGNCALMAAGLCLDRGGLPQGPGSFCGALSCLQACCFPDGGCSDLPPGDCTAQGGAPGGLGTSCATEECPPQCTAPVLRAALSFARHDTGDFYIELDITNTNASRTSEPRSTGLRVLEFQFNQPVVSAAIEIYDGLGFIAGGPLTLVPGPGGANSAGRIILNAPLPNMRAYTIRVRASSGPGCDLRHDLCVVALVGDFDSNSRVNVADKGALLGFVFQPVTQMNARYDVQVGSGASINVGDVGFWTGFFGNAAFNQPCPPAP